MILQVDHVFQHPLSTAPRIRYSMLIRYPLESTRLTLPKTNRHSTWQEDVGAPRPKRKTHLPIPVFSGVYVYIYIFVYMFWGIWGIQKLQLSVSSHIPLSVLAPAKTKERIHWSPADVEPEASGEPFTIRCSIHFMRVDPVYWWLPQPNRIHGTGWFTYCTLGWFLWYHRIHILIPSVGMDEILYNICTLDSYHANPALQDFAIQGHVCGRTKSNSTPSSLQLLDEETSQTFLTNKKGVIPAPGCLDIQWLAMNACSRFRLRREKKQMFINSTPWKINMKHNN